MRFAKREKSADILEQNSDSQEELEINAQEQIREEKQNSEEPEGGYGFSFSYFCAEAASLLLMAYLFIVFCMYPLYMQRGYLDIGNDKYNFYRDITVGAFSLIVPFAAICTILRIRDKEIRLRNWYRGMSVTDWAVFAYGIGLIISFICSDYKAQALWGEDGWYMGIITQMMFVVSYFLVSRFWEFEAKILLGFMAAAAVVFGLGLLNRFSVFPVEVLGANSSFLSTLGNINWYSGYWSVLFPIGFMLYWFTGKSLLRLVGFLFTIIGTATGVSQGSSSAFIVFSGLYVFTFCLSFKSLDKMKRFWELVMIFCAVCQGLRLWRIWIPDSFNYYDGTLSDRITMSRITLAGLAGAIIIYALLYIMGRRKTDIHSLKALRQITLLAAVLGAGVYLFLLVLNTRIEGGIRFMGSMSSFIFDERWGSSRGATWIAGAEIYRSMPIPRKLVGAGSDCFALYLDTIADLAKRVAKQFDGARLTNAHNEWLTVLVNNGIIGFISYAGIFSSAVVRCVYYAEKALSGRRKYLYIFGMCAFSYTIHNVVSFQQILSTPFIFLLLGMGERLVREERHSGA